MDYFTEKRSKKPLFIIAGAIVALLVVGIAVAMALGGDSEMPSTTTSTQETTESDVATNEQVQQGFKDIETSTKQSAEDQASAKDALTDDKKQIKVGS